MTFENFIDKVNIYCKSGTGGNGIVHFRREKFVYKGGPDGGDGGEGGSIFLRGNENFRTLLHFKYNKNFKAQNGFPGQRSRKKGASGKKLILNVPIGTIARDKQGNIVCEIIHNKQENLLLVGGKGGLGNWHFRNSVNRIPLFAQEGQPGIELWLTLELKILADVALIGYPNAGKSTLLSLLTSAKPSIENYAFTTLTPKLGFVKYKYKEEKSLIISDVPGLLKGASKGKGIGLRFLRHVERNVILLFLISSEETNIFFRYKILLQELSYYKYYLLEKNRMITISKTDLIEGKINIQQNISVFCISAHYYKGLNNLKNELYNKIKNSDPAEL